MPCFSDLSFAKKTRKKALGAIAPVDKNKPRSERLYGTVYLKIFCSINGNSF